MPKRSQEQRLSSSFLAELDRARLLRGEGRFEQAIGLLEGLLTSHPNHVGTLEEVAKSEWCLGHLRRARRAAQRAVSLSPGSMMGSYLLGAAASLEGVWEEAVKHLRTANHLQPNTPEILRALGWALFQKGEPVEGLVTIERALNLGDEHAVTLCDLAEVHLALSDMAKARALFLRVLDTAPGNTRAKKGMRRCDRAVQRRTKSAPMM